MRLKRYLHIESVLDKRGPELIRKTYQVYLPMLKWDPSINSYNIYTENPRYQSLVELLDKDQNLSHHVATVKRCLDENASIYYFPKDFLRALSGLDREVPLDYVPDKFWGIFEFAEGALADDTGEVWSAYVYIGKLKYHHSRNMDCDGEDKIVSISYVNKAGSICKFSWPLHSDTIKNIVTDAHTNWKGSADTVMKQNEDGTKVPQKVPITVEESNERAKIIIACINAVLYITSEDPELMDLKPDKSLSMKARQQQSSTGWNNLCTVPVIIVNHSYRQPKQYSTDSAWWNTFLRWQPCGPNRSRIKLVWVKAHEKKFRRSHGESESSDGSEDQSSPS